jgi:hypothetical protein
MDRQTYETLVIRSGDAGDFDVARLAALDSKTLAPGGVLVAEADGRPLAALSLIDGQVAADPFAFTIQLVALLEQHATQLPERAGIRRLLPQRRRLLPNAA